VLSPSLATVRLFLHVLAACVWVGGQIVLAGLVPSLRAAGPDAPRAAARRFNRLAWPAFAVLVVTGVWNLLDVDVADRSSAYHVTLGVKLLVVALSGVSAALHAGARSRIALAAWGAVSGLSALGALWLGVQLRG
jgi:putative copper export protein